MPRGELATTGRDRAANAVGRALRDGSDQTAAVLLLAMAEGYAESGDVAGGLDLARRSLDLSDADEETRIGALDLAAELAVATSDFELGTPEALRDLSVSLDRVAEIEEQLGHDVEAEAAHRRAAEAENHYTIITGDA